MLSPLNLAKKSLTDSPKKKFAPPGTYDSILTKIEPAPGFETGHAFTFFYELTDVITGKKFTKSEVILNDYHNSRFKTIIDSITDEGINVENIEDLLHMHERITIKKVVSNGHPYSNIVERSFLGFKRLEDAIHDTLR